MWPNFLTFDLFFILSTAPCTEEDFELEYSDCGTYRSNIVMNIASEYDPVVVKQVLTNVVRTFVEETYAAENDNQADTIYDYPKWVQAAVYIELVGVSKPMDDDEMFLFLQEYEGGFRPIMEEDNYDWINNEIMYQENTTSAENFTAEERNVINKVKIMPKATCSGDSCNNENFYNYLIVNLDQFAGELLGRLQTISPSGSDVYYNDIVQIIVRNEELEVPELPAEENTDLTAKNAGDDKDIPFWLWLFVLLAVLVVVCTLLYICFLSPRRKAVSSEKEEDEDELDRQNNIGGDHQSQETPI